MQFNLLHDINVSSSFATPTLHLTNRKIQVITHFQWQNYFICFDNCNHGQKHVLCSCYSMNTRCIRRVEDGELRLCSFFMTLHLGMLCAAKRVTAYNIYSSSIILKKHSG